MRQWGGQIDENHYPDRDRTPYPTNLEAKGPKSGRKIEGSHQCCGKNKAVQKETKALEEGRHQWSEINEGRDRKDMRAAMLLRNKSARRRKGQAQRHGHGHQFWEIYERRQRATKAMKDTHRN